MHLKKVFETNAPTSIRNSSKHSLLRHFPTGNQSPGLPDTCKKFNLRLNVAHGSKCKSGDGGHHLVIGPIPFDGAFDAILAVQKDLEGLGIPAKAVTLSALPIDGLILKCSEKHPNMPFSSHKQT